MAKQAAHLELDEIQWDAVGQSRRGPETRLLGTVAVTVGEQVVMHHLEALEVWYDEFMWCTRDPAMQATFDRYHDGDDGPWQTVEIDGRWYVLIMSPFSR